MAKESPFARTRDPAALVNPVVTIETIRRVVAEALRAPAVSIAGSLQMVGKPPTAWRRLRKRSNFYPRWETRSARWFLPIARM
jgi:hypothetical protein